MINRRCLPGMVRELSLTLKSNSCIESAPDAEKDLTPRTEKRI
jgi:hypothetical protein